MLRTSSILLPFLFVAATGCGSKPYTGAPRYPLSGKVTANGKPIDMGTISFIPASEAQRVSGGPITDGEYSVPEEKGANAGQYRVEIHWWRATGKEVRDPDGGGRMEQRIEGLPARYHKESTLSALVSDKQSTFDFDLQLD